VTPPSSPAHSAEPIAEMAEGDLVPIDPGTAAAATQPAHQPPAQIPRPEPKANQLVDPLMLGPQPLPKPKVKRDEIAVVCFLCRTRMYAPIERVGQMIQCPDCHSLNEVKAPKAPPEKKKSGPTLDDAPEIILDNPADRPAYRPIVDPRGEYAALAEFEPRQRPPGWSQPEATGPASGGQPAAVPVAVAQAVDEDDDEDVQITVAPPVERLEIKPEIKPLPPPDPEEDLYDGKYDDGLIGDLKVDRKAKDAWKKAPLVIGILGFLFYMSTLPRLALYIAGLIFAVTVSHAAFNYAVSEDLSEQVLAIFATVVASLSLGFFVASFSAVLLAIVQDTANGDDEVSSYPDWNIIDWIMTSAYFPAAAFVAGLPGSFFTVAMITIGGLDTQMGAFAAGAPLIISWIALFPFVLYSMLAEGSVLAPYSQATYRSTQVASEGWVFFYMYAILLGILGSLALAMAGVSGSNAILFIPRAFGCTGLVIVAVLYCRILGRLMWYASEKMAKLERQEERRRAAAGA
jgi:hypothetical protein